MDKNLMPFFITDDLVNKDDLFKVDQIVNKTYLSELYSFPIVPFDEKKHIDISDSACFFPVRKMVFDKEENIVQKLTSVFTGAVAVNANLAMLIRGYSEDKTKIYLGVCNETNRINGAYPKTKAFYDSFVGNFPGCRDDDPILGRKEMHILANSCFSYDYNAVSSVSCIGSLRGKSDNRRNVDFYQGIEKVIETMSGKDYTILILAQPILSDQIQAIRTELEGLYSRLSSFSKINLSLNESEAKSISDSVSLSLTESFNESKSESLSVGESHSHSVGAGTFSSDSLGTHAGIGIAGGSYGYSFGNSTNVSDTDGTNKSETKAETKGIGKSIGKVDVHGNTETLTKGKTVQLSIEQKKISEILSVISQQLQRLKSGSGIGMFATAAYFLSPTLSESLTAAGVYKALVSGDSTSIEYNGVNSWTHDSYKQIYKYLKNLQHPVFCLSGKIDSGNESRTTPATILTSSELAVQMGLPYHSVNGVPVKESVSFGRNVVKLSGNYQSSDDLCIGNIYHLGLSEASKVRLNSDSMTMHTFITGTTGSGKSNTVYGILNKVAESKKGIRFLVVEPAKGEYKSAFADRRDVTVYGINPYLTPLLRINPFRFRNGIHILEHIDKLLNIFNVCWPMEAAMPAVLKQALERAYQSAGWDIKRSKNYYSENLYPSFTDVMQEVEIILSESSYSDETKGNYVGALCTRLRELTTGLNGMIFSVDDLPDEKLFEENVIVDLSRIGSPETKSLIMGLIVIRLHEYRQTAQKSLKTGLSHITVLEEAHHLLKRTSTEQSMDGANLVGKSVEILTNAFAEMRSAGEGFIIADQSPGLLDKSVIRNTNTKIVLRLPESEDRELVGKSIGLSEMQIAELSKLPTGVAAVYQNDWLDAVLVKIPYFDVGDDQYNYKLEDESIFEGNDDVLSLLNQMVVPDGVDNMINSLPDNRIDSITSLKLPTKVKKQLIYYIVNKDERKIMRLGKLACDFFNVREVIKLSDADSVDDLIGDFKSYLRPSIRELDEWDQNTLLLIIFSEFARRYVEYEPIYLSAIDRLA